MSKRMTGHSSMQHWRTCTRSQEDSFGLLCITQTELRTCLPWQQPPLPQVMAILAALMPALGLSLTACLSPAGVHFLQFSKFVQLVTFKVPWFTSGYSYCHWWGITCCLTSTVLVLPQCTEGFQSVGQLTLPGAVQPHSCHAGSY